MLECSLSFGDGYLHWIFTRNYFLDWKHLLNREREGTLGTRLRRPSASCNANPRGRGKRAFLKGFTASFLENGISIELFCRREDSPGNVFGCEKEFKRTGL